MLHGKPPVSARCMIERRCLITGYGSTGSFPGDFVELENGFVSPQRRVGPPDDRISPRVNFCSRGVAPRSFFLAKQSEEVVE
jgi:hypothetical protein